MIKIHYTTIVLLVLSYVFNYMENYLVMLLLITLHELAHLVVVLCCKYEFVSLTILPFGGILEYKGSNKFDLLLATSGILLNCILILFDFYVYFNLVIILVNIIPIYPLDGYKILSCFKISEKILVFISISTLVIVSVLSLYYKYIILFIVVSFLFYKQKNILNQDARKIISIKRELV